MCNNLAQIAKDNKYTKHLSLAIDSLVNFKDHPFKLYDGKRF